MYPENSRTIRADRDGNRKPYKPSTPNKPASPKGHDAVLKAIQDDGRTINITLLSGETMSGTLVARDKFTISVLVNVAGKIEDAVFVVFKHGIESFWAVRPLKSAVTE